MYRPRHLWRHSRVFTAVASLVAIAVVAGIATLVVVLTRAPGNPSGPHGLSSTRPVAALGATTPPVGSGVVSPNGSQSAASPQTSAGQAPASSTGSTSTERAPLTYTVKPGDTLYDIARFFHLHGYGRLYERNRRVIGDNPARIFPGQTITISGSGVTVGGQ